MNWPKFTVSWIDLLTVIIIIAGVIRGRKRGMSEELLDVIMWVLILAAAAYICEPTGIMLAQSTVFSLLSCYVAVYAAIILVLKLLFTYIRRSTGDKLVTSDAFGSSEYYLGMVAGGFRYCCILVVVLAFLHARYYSPEDLKAYETYQMRNYGSQFFPSLGTFQAEVFDRSLTGTMARDYLSVFLIRPTAPEDKSLQRSSIATGREQNIKQLLDRR